MEIQYNVSNTTSERPDYISSKPIPFSKTKKELVVQYEIKRNYFDPDKHSPPSIWRNRLLERIEIHINNKKSNHN